MPARFVTSSLVTKHAGIASCFVTLVTKHAVVTKRAGIASCFVTLVTKRAVVTKRAAIHLFKLRKKTVLTNVYAYLFY